jgi:hypothetical protein
MIKANIIEAAYRAEVLNLLFQSSRRIYRKFAP